MSNVNKKYDALVKSRNYFYSLTGRNLKNISFKIFFFNIKYVKLLLIRKSLLNSGRLVSINFLRSKIFIDVNDGSNQNIFLFGILSKKEDALTKFLLYNLSHQDVFYDIGASYGYYSVLASSLITQGEIHSFEPNKNVSKFLQKTVTYLNQKIKVQNNQLAISNVSKELEFYDYGISSSSSISTLHKNENNQEYPEKYETYKVSATTLDEYLLTQDKKPTFIKVDIESGEKDFIEGAKDFLSRHDPVVILELKLNTSDDIDFSYQCIDLMKNLNYLAYVIKDDGGLQLLTKEYLTSEKCKNKSYENCVFKK